MNHSENISQLAEAFAAFQADVRNPPKDQSATIKMKAGGEFTYRFAALSDVLETVRPLLAKHGLSVVQELVTDTAGGLGCSTLLMHASGQFIGFAPFFVPATGDAKDHGSAASYARRYALMAALNLAAADDDAGVAGQVPRPPAKAQPKNDAGEAMATSRQLGKIKAEAEDAGLTDAQLKLKKSYGVETTSELTRDQASDLIARLLKYREEQTPEAPDVDPAAEQARADAEHDPDDDIPF